MKSKFIFTFVALIFTLLTNAQTVQDTTVVSIETKSGGRYTGQIVFENKDSIKINDRDLGIVTILTSEIIYQDLVTIETNDGNEFIGKIVKEDYNTITIKTQKFGEITISKSDIKTKHQIEVQQIKDGKYWFPNPQSTRYFWSPNGYGLKKGEGYYQNIWVLWNQFSYGITNNVSVGGGIIPTFLFGAPTPVFGTIKFSVPFVKNKFNIAAGAIGGAVIGEGDFGGLGIVYGLATVGSHDANITFGMGYGFFDGEWSQSPMFNINGMFRVSSRGYIITENYIIPESGETVVLFSLGGRSIIKKAALDYGLIVPFSGYGVEIAIPWLGFTLPFGKTN